MGEDADQAQDDEEGGQAKMDLLQHEAEGGQGQGGTQLTQDHGQDEEDEDSFSSSHGHNPHGCRGRRVTTGGLARLVRGRWR